MRQRKRRLRGCAQIAAISLALALAGPAAHALPHFYWGSGCASPYGFGTVDVATGVRTTITSARITALAFSPTGTLYWGSGCSSPSGFGTIDPETGARTTIASGWIDALAFGPDGTLYWAEGSASPSGFGTIDPVTGARTTIVGGYISALAFAPDGTLYWGSGCANPSGFGTIESVGGSSPLPGSTSDNSIYVKYGPEELSPPRRGDFKLRGGRAGWWVAVSQLAFGRLAGRRAHG